MEQTESQKLVKALKELKEQNEITFPRILELMETKGKTVSLSTLRRVFSNGSDANSFSYENTLLPIKEALQSIESGEVIQNAHSKELEALRKEIDGLKAVVACQNEELSQLYQTKEFLQERIRFMQDQITKKDDRIDKLMEKVL